MCPGDPDTQRAEDEVVRQAGLVIVGLRPVGPDLESAVRSLTLNLRASGNPPEKALAAVKHAAFRAGAGTVIRDDSRGAYRTTNEVVGRMVRWFVDAYYGAAEKS